MAEHQKNLAKIRYENFVLAKNKILVPPYPILQTYPKENILSNSKVKSGESSILRIKCIRRIIG